MTQDENATMNESTGLPRIRRWKTVYLIVFTVFLVWVGLLTWLTIHYS
jgi:hypothetical protein